MKISKVNKSVAAHGFGWTSKYQCVHRVNTRATASDAMVRQ